MERIDGASAATLGDLEACRTAHRRLHALGIKHGDVNRNNFLVQHGANVAIIDFETARKCEDNEQLQMELMGLGGSFRDPTNRGGEVYVEVDE